MIPQAVYAMLHVLELVRFIPFILWWFSAHAIADRLTNCGVKVLLLTRDEGRRGGNTKSA